MANVPYAARVVPGKKLRLKDHDPGRRDGLEKEAGRARTTELAKEISELQELMFAAKQHSLLIVFQGPDTGGKDGAINKALSYLHAQTSRTTSFKVPTEEEAEHDFLWRVHPHAPGKGGIAFFNRSHYEDVLVVRVHKYAPKEVIEERYARINEFEALLAANNTIILKFFLHISPEEQEERLLAREQDPIKSWKLSPNDWKEREFWADYVKAYEVALTKCSTKDAPWFIVPANYKWFRDLAVAEAIAEALRPFREQWTAELERIGAEALETLKAYRAEKAEKP
jgi:PPK2 family polyphosphate:nucleotide phosphotransferase